MRSRTWLITVFRGDTCLTAENVVGSASFISRLTEVASILVCHAGNLAEYELAALRADVAKDTDKKYPESWQKTYTTDEIKSLAAAYDCARVLK